MSEAEDWAVIVRAKNQEIQKWQQQALELSNLVMPLRDEVARLRALLLRIRPEMHCMSSQLRASGYRDGATLREVLADLEAAITPQAGKGGGA